MKYNMEQTLELLDQVVELVGPEYKDPASEGGTQCVYTYKMADGEEKHCIVGSVFFDVLADRRLMELAWEFNDAGVDDIMEHTLDGKTFEPKFFTHGGWAILRHAQRLQDAGNRWSHVVQKLREGLNDADIELVAYWEREQENRPDVQLLPQMVKLGPEEGHEIVAYLTEPELEAERFAAAQDGGW